MCNVCRGSCSCLNILYSVQWQRRYKVRTNLGHGKLLDTSTILGTETNCCGFVPCYTYLWYYYLLLLTDNTRACTPVCNRFFALPINSHHQQYWMLSKMHCNRDTKRNHRTWQNWKEWRDCIILRFGATHKTESTFQTPWVQDCRKSSDELKFTPWCRTGP